MSIMQQKSGPKPFQCVFICLLLISFSFQQAIFQFTSRATSSSFGPSPVLLQQHKSSFLSSFSRFLSRLIFLPVEEMRILVLSSTAKMAFYSSKNPTAGQQATLSFFWRKNARRKKHYTSIKKTWAPDTSSFFDTLLTKSNK